MIKLENRLHGSRESSWIGLAVGEVEGHPIQDTGKTNQQDFSVR